MTKAKKANFYFQIHKANDRDGEERRAQSLSLKSCLDGDAEAPKQS